MMKYDCLLVDGGSKEKLFGNDTSWGVNDMKVLHLMASGETGGIEVLLKNYLPYSKNANYFVFIWQGGVIAEEIRKAGAQVVILNIKKDGVLSVWNKISDICQKENIDVMVTHHGAPLMKVLLLAAKKKFPGLCTIAYAHACAEEKSQKRMSIKQWTVKQIQSYAFNHADGVVAISNSVKGSLIKYLSTKPEKIHVIYNGTQIISIEKADRDNDPIKLIFVGRLTKEKGVQTILFALADLAENLDFEFQIVGDGPYRKNLENLVKELNLCSKVFFCGTRRDVPERLCKCDIFIHMPICEEGFGITIVEAMAAGCVCVCAEKGGIPEIIHDEVDGYLVSSGEKKELVEVLQRLIPAYKNGQCQEIQNNAINRASEFSIQNYSNQLDAYLENVIQRCRW